MILKPGKYRYKPLNKVFTLTGICVCSICKTSIAAERGKIYVKSLDLYPPYIGVEVFIQDIEKIDSQLMLFEL